MPRGAMALPAGAGDGFIVYTIPGLAGPLVRKVCVERGSTARCTRDSITGRALARTAAARPGQSVQLVVLARPSTWTSSQTSTHSWSSSPDKSPKSSSAASKAIAAASCRNCQPPPAPGGPVGGQRATAPPRRRVRGPREASPVPHRSGYCATRPRLVGTGGRRPGDSQRDRLVLVGDLDGVAVRRDGFVDCEAGGGVFAGHRQVVNGPLGLPGHAKWWPITPPSPPHDPPTRPRSPMPPGREVAAVILEEAAVDSLLDDGVTEAENRLGYPPDLPMSCELTQVSDRAPQRRAAWLTVSSTGNRTGPRQRQR